MKSKQFIALPLILLTLISCSLENDNITFSQDILSIDSVVVPNEFIFGQTHEIFVTYNRPSSCHEFFDFFYQINGNERVVSVINTVYQNNNCTPINEETTVSFNINITSTETYIFKFYQGQSVDAQGISFDEYLIVEVPVVQ